MRCSWFKFKNPINLIGWKYFLTMPNFKFKKHLLRFLNLYLAAKNQVDWSIFSWDIADLRILQPDCYRAFWLIAQKPEFSQIWDLCKQKTNNLNFHLTPNPEKSNNTIFGKSLKTFLFGHFWAFFPLFRKNFFPFFQERSAKIPRKLRDWFTQCGLNSSYTVTSIIPGKSMCSIISYEIMSSRCSEIC